MMYEGEFLTISRRSSIEYPSRIVVTEIFVEDKEDNNENFFFDDLHFLDVGKYTARSKKVRKEAIALFLKRIKKEAKSVTDCQRIYAEVFEQKEKESSLIKQSDKTGEKHES